MPHQRHILSAAIAAMLMAGTAIAATQTATPSQKKIYCWDEGGRRVCGDALPASAVDSARTEFNAKSGLATGHVERTWLGVSIRGLNREGGGVMVVGVAQGGPAAAAGLRPGDVIVAIDQRPVKSDRDLLSYLNDKRSGTQVQLTVEREGKRSGLGVTLQPAPQQMFKR